jgi:hypothetical protein
MSVMDWNGREIRNAFQAAIALAECDQCANKYCTEDEENLVEGCHFEKVINISRSFQKYMNSIRGDSEAKRAAQ